MSRMTRLWVANNRFQGPRKRVLCCCSAGVLRSPTTAAVLCQEPYNFNTRSAGLENYALIPVDEVLLSWAHEIVVMEPHQQFQVLDLCSEFQIAVPEVKVLNIPDNFEYMQPELVKLIKEAYEV